MPTDKKYLKRENMEKNRDVHLGNLIEGGLSLKR
jgi:hypothetical protein